MPITDFAEGPDLAARLVLERIGPTTFLGECGPGPAHHAFGGHVAALAVLAAGRTVDPAFALRSLHAYFLRPALAGQPVEYRVDPLHDGRSAALRSVTAHQDGRRVFTLGASFQIPDSSTHAQIEAPDVPSPDGLPVGLAGPVEVRPIDWSGRLGDVAPRQRIWLRCPVPLPDDALIQAAAATFASDLTLGWSPWKALGIHAVSGEMYGASIDHSMWFHRPVRVDEWLLVDQHSQAVADGRGLAMGHLFDARGNLVITTAQEGLMRGIHIPRPEAIGAEVVEAAAVVAAGTERGHDIFVIV